MLKSAVSNEWGWCLKKIGLTLGKFAPLHLGHQWVIETALAEMDEVIVLVYATEVTHIALNVRAAWIRERYPNVCVIECWDNPSDTVSCERQHEIREEDYIVKQLAGRRVTHFYSSECYGAHVSQRLQAVDRRVDEARLQVPISATQIRAQPYHYRHFVSAQVYWDMLLKCVFLGTVSTGKSTLVEALASHCNTVGVPEYGRVYWAEHQQNRRLRPDELDTIATTHQAWEYRMAHGAQDVVFVDTNALTTRLFCIDYHGQSTPTLEALAHANASRYDLFFLCLDDIPYDDTWDRSGPQKREVLQQQILADLHRRKIPYHLVAGSVDERMRSVGRTIAEYQQRTHDDIQRVDVV